MIFDTYATQAAQASLDSLWMQSKVISTNMANVDTPGYKSKHVSFEQVLKDTNEQYSGKMTDSRKASSMQNGTRQSPSSVQSGAGGSGSGASISHFRSKVMTDADTEVRVDGNNVSLEREQTELWKTYAQYSYLLDRVSGHYNNINSAINNMRT